MSNGLDPDQDQRSEDDKSCCNQGKGVRSTAALSESSPRGYVISTILSTILAWEFVVQNCLKP